MVLRGKRNARVRHVVPRPSRSLKMVVRKRGRAGLKSVGTRTRFFFKKGSHRFHVARSDAIVSRDDKRRDSEGGRKEGGQERP